MASVVPPSVRAGLAPLYAGHAELRAVTDAVLEGRQGVASADAAPPGVVRVARLDLGCYAIFGGDAGAEAARELVETVLPPRELVFPDDDVWRRLLRRTHPALVERPMRAFATDGLDLGHLRRLASATPAGFEVARIDAALAARLGPEHEPHAMQAFDSPKDFAARGIGFCAIGGGEIACAATSYAACADRIELAIATHPRFRGRGLAQAVSARLMAECLERGIVPHWNAGNPISQRLAVRLGYRPAGVCEILYLNRPSTG